MSSILNYIIQTYIYKQNNSRRNFVNHYTSQKFFNCFSVCFFNGYKLYNVFVSFNYSLLYTKPACHGIVLYNPYPNSIPDSDAYLCFESAEIEQLITVRYHY